MLIFFKMYATSVYYSNFLSQNNKKHVIVMFVEHVGYVQKIKVFAFTFYGNEHKVFDLISN